MINYNKKGKEGRSRIRVFFLGEGGERLGLGVEEGERFRTCTRAVYLQLHSSK